MDFRCDVVYLWEISLIAISWTSEELSKLYRLIFISALVCFVLPLTLFMSMQGQTLTNGANVLDGQRLFKAAAKGVKVYVCTLNIPYSTRDEWKLKGPDAILTADGFKINLLPIGESR
jgi:hypothetical protein